MSDLVWALNLVSGQVGRINRHILEHATLGEQQIEVAPGTKSYLPELWHPTTKSEFLNSNPPVAITEADDEDHADHEGNE